jgi:hypothetical protein
LLKIQSFLIVQIAHAIRTIISRQGDPPFQLGYDSLSIAMSWQRDSNGFPTSLGKIALQE